MRDARTHDQRLRRDAAARSPIDNGATHSLVRHALSQRWPGLAGADDARAVAVRLAVASPSLVSEYSLPSLDRALQGVEWMMRDWRQLVRPPGQPGKHAGTQSGRFAPRDQGAAAVTLTSGEDQHLAAARTTVLRRETPQMCGTASGIFQHPRDPLRPSPPHIEGRHIVPFRSPCIAPQFKGAPVIRDGPPRSLGTSRASQWSNARPAHRNSRSAKFRRCAGRCRASG